LYAYKIEVLTELERLSEQGWIKLFYADESHVCSQGYVPYGWQFPGEEVFISSQKGYRLNVFGMISRGNECLWSATTDSIKAELVLEKLDMLSLSINQPTYIVLDKASVHRSKIIEQRIKLWQSRGLYLFFLPPYSPHLNIAETMWRHLKGGWLRAEDYQDNESLAYALNRCMANIGVNLKINFKPFNAN
jgi:transposase